MSFLTDRLTWKRLRVDRTSTQSISNLGGGMGGKMD